MMSLETISWREFERRRRQEPGMVVDLRNRGCYLREHVPGAISLPYMEWEERRQAFARCTPIYLYCTSGSTALLVGRELSAEGYWAVAVMGGYPKSCEFE